VSEHIKGKDKEELSYDSEIRDPKVVIKLKQPLSYAKDMIKSYELSKYQKAASASKEESHRKKNKQNTIPEISFEDKTKPNRDWIYVERIKLTAGLRWLILKRDNFKCRSCGRGVEDGAKLEVDHIIPVSRWGETKESNLRTLCRQCNQGKGHTV